MNDRIKQWQIYKNQQRFKQKQKRIFVTKVKNIVILDAGHAFIIRLNLNHTGLEGTSGQQRFQAPNALLGWNTEACSKSNSKEEKLLKNRNLKLERQWVRNKTDFWICNPPPSWGGVGSAIFASNEKKGKKLVIRKWMQTISFASVWICHIASIWAPQTWILFKETQRGFLFRISRLCHEVIYIANTPSVLKWYLFDRKSNKKKMAFLGIVWLIVLRILSTQSERSQNCYIFTPEHLIW
jgi:hypothetical protein